MAERATTLDSIDYKRLFPWLTLLRAFWIAVDIRKLLLAAAALLLTAAGSWAFDRLPFSPVVDNPEALAVADAHRWPWQQSLGYDLWHGPDALSEMRGVLHDPWHTLGRIAVNWQLILRPLEMLLQPSGSLFQADMTARQLAYEVTCLLWALCVWSVCGGAIGRMIAVQYARDQKTSLLSALKFSLTHFFDYLSAPLMPLAGVGVLWALCAFGSTLGRIPVVGELLVGTFLIFALVFGFAMALILIGVAAGWPLMFATISTEATDGFDGLSRAYNYAFERPWHYLGYTLFAMLYGSVVVFFVWLMAQIAVVLTAWAVSWGAGYETAARLFSDPPTQMGIASLIPPPGEPGSFDFSWGSRLAGGWLRGVATLVLAFVYSFFWTSTAIMYFLLRRGVDGNDLDEVEFEDPHEDDDLQQLAGIAGVETDASTGAPAPTAPGSEPGPTDPSMSPPVPDLAP